MKKRQSTTNCNTLEEETIKKMDIQLYIIELEGEKFARVLNADATLQELREKLKIQTEYYFIYKDAEIQEDEEWLITVKMLSKDSDYIQISPKISIEQQCGECDQLKQRIKSLQDALNEAVQHPTFIKHSYFDYEKLKPKFQKLEYNQIIQRVEFIRNFIFEAYIQHKFTPRFYEHVQNASSAQFDEQFYVIVTDKDELQKMFKEEYIFAHMEHKIQVFTGFSLKNYESL